MAKSEKNKPQITPMLRQFLDVKEKHPDKLVLFRMGDFYETFFDDAAIASKYLGITLTARNKKNDNPIPLAGFPYHALDTYLDKLVKSGLKVVICEQVEDPKTAKGLVKRDIVEIITPGAIIDENLIDKSDNNFLTAVFKDSKHKKIGVASIDISTGDFVFTEILFSQLHDEITRLHPVEIITIDKELEAAIEGLKIEYQPVLSFYENPFFDPPEAKNILKRQFQTTSLEGFSASSKPVGATAAGMVLSYLQSLKNDKFKHVTSLRYYSLDDYMLIDDTTRRNLELVRSMRFNTKSGTLISILDKTKTPMGSRLLQEWLLHPLLNIPQISLRLDAVEEMNSKIHFTNDLRDILNKIGDLSRIISKVATLRINPRDMIALVSYISTAPIISSLLENFQSETLIKLKENIENYQEIIDLINTAISENPPVQITDGNIIKDGFNTELDELRQISRDGKGWIARLEASEKQKTEIPSLKIRYNKVFGYYIEVTKIHVEKIPDYYIRKQTLVNCERYISPELKEYESKVLGAEERIKNIEYEIFIQLRKQLFENVELMKKYVDVLSHIDVLANLAHISYNNNYCRPDFNNNNILEMEDCRHPVIEKLLENEEFIPNNVYLDQDKYKIGLITGPNMAGKSTYLRQVGLITIMAQMGGFVPCTKASLPIFDKVFTRVGASDNLAQGQSTFLVEMLETANILNSATPKSLILLDEIGRGTSTFDGLSLAWSIVEYIHNKKNIQSKTLFATHYHELTELENVLSGVKNYNVVVKEFKDKMIFLRKIERGGADKSYGIQVARLAGIPNKVIRRAKQILANLEEHELSPQGLTAQAKKQLITKSPQMDIFEVIFEKDEQKDIILDEIRDLDLENTTPIQALQLLADLQKKL